MRRWGIRHAGQISTGSRPDNNRQLFGCADLASGAPFRRSGQRAMAGAGYRLGFARVATHSGLTHLSETGRIAHMLVARVPGQR